MNFNTLLYIHIGASLMALLVLLSLKFTERRGEDTTLAELFIIIFGAICPVVNILLVVFYIFYILEDKLRGLLEFLWDLGQVVIWKGKK